MKKSLLVSGRKIDRVSILFDIQRRGRSCRITRRKDDISSGMQHVTSVGMRDNLNASCKAVVNTYGFSREDLQQNVIMGSDANPLVDPKVLESADLEARVAVNGSMSQPFQNHRDRQDPLPSKNVRLQERELGDIEFNFQHDLEIAGLFEL